MPLLTINDLDYSYGPQQVLSNLSLELEYGTLAALIGYNGAGKSTLLRCIAGWTLPHRGDISINNQSIHGQEQQLRRMVILVPDAPDFYDELTAWEHLQLVARLHQAADWKQRGLMLLENFQLLNQRSAFPFTFSRGMRYKLALCMALLVDPPLLLLDEPLGALDAVSVQFLWNYLQEYRTRNKSILFSSHVLPDEGKPDVFFLLRDQQIKRIESADTDIAHILNHD
ncbi:MAG: ABC transporter ATP-binding protein [Anaerolineae bacterium]